MTVPRNLADELRALERRARDLVADAGEDLDQVVIDAEQLADDIAALAALCPQPRRPAPRDPRAATSPAAAKP